jgi:DNA repair protein RadD
MANDIAEIEWFKVQRTFYRKHEKEGRPPSINVTYTCGIRGFQEWVCLEHGGLAGHNAREWWRRRFNGEPPDTTDEALRYVSQLKEPVRIAVHVNTKWPRVVQVEF